MTEKYSDDQVSWDKVFSGTATIGEIPKALRDFHLRLLRLEGNFREAERLEGLRYRSDLTG